MNNESLVKPPSPGHLDAGAPPSSRPASSDASSGVMTKPGDVRLEVQVEENVKLLLSPASQKKETPIYRPPSTFYLKSPAEMTVAEKICDAATCPAEVHEVKLPSLDRGPVPTQPVWRENVFILSRALVPLAVQQISYWLFPDLKWPVFLAHPFYLVAFIAFALQVMRRMNHYCVKLGCLDEAHSARDRTPDKEVKQLAKNLLAYMVVRTGLGMYLCYDKNAQPLLNFGWTFPLRLALWQILLDYLFYAYHRASHEVDALWFVHQHHHATKHPTPILAVLADSYQEYLEVLLLPLLTTLAVPFSFSEHYLAQCYTMYVEMLGHSGVRSHWRHPVLWPLEWGGMGIAVEDHELHHRGGKKGRNYGKQTRIWDRLFGTCAERVETYGL
ncbi:hypothetical protein JCM10207_006232 [Rhodosporidiobolus poonsookiae]